MVESAKIQFIIRDFTDEKLAEHEEVIQCIVDDVMAHYPRSKANVKIAEQYRNMKKVLDAHPKVVSYAIDAIKRAGLKPYQSSIRGGTDGSRLSFMGLPCPNVFAGEHAFHSRQEWVSVQDMEKAAETIVHLCAIWEENS
jgi:tripeptide aminopeptidase